MLVEQKNHIDFNLKKVLEHH